MMPIYKKAENVIIEQKDKSRIIISNPVKKTKTVLKDKIDIEIIYPLISEDLLYVEIMTTKLHIHKNRIISMLKKLEEKGYLVNCTEEYELFD